MKTWRTSHILPIGIWLAGLAAIMTWSAFVLSPSAFARLADALVRTLTMSSVVVLTAALLAWLFTMSGYFMRNVPPVRYALSVAVDTLRSIPQIVGLLLVYLSIGLMLTNDDHMHSWTVSVLLSFGTAFFVFLEAYDATTARINHFSGTELMNALRVCGMKEFRLVNVEILWKNGRTMVLQKLFALFGSTIFLLCAVDFVLSVGLASDVRSTNLPQTLGSLMARLDSKQDILAIGLSLKDPSKMPDLFVLNWQGLSAAVLIIFTLICFHRTVRNIGSLPDHD